MDRSRPAIAAAARLHYVYLPYRAEVMHWFCKPSPAMRTHHLHLVPAGSRLWVERLAFRDYLRQHPGVAEEYAAPAGLVGRGRDVDLGAVVAGRYG